MKRIPLNTYRLQLTPTFGFEAVRRLLPYLKSMGVTDLYLSPIFKACAGSTHGYDVTDPALLNPELGSRAEFDALVREVKREGFGWIQDIVPNHMAFCGENAMLMDVLEKGRDSDYATLFDIYWEHPDESLRGRILAPFLGRFLGECLARGEITLSYGEQGFFVNYAALKFPLRLESYRTILEAAVQLLAESAGRGEMRFRALLLLLADLAEHPESNSKNTYTPYVKRTLWRLCQEDADVRGGIDRAVEALNAEQGEGRDALVGLLQRQAFRLSFWKVSSQEISYRRFFNIDGLICVRVEEAAVFDRTHALILQLAGECFTALRIDHIDGLFDPGAYLARLHGRHEEVALYVEKILAQEETLPPDWPVEGTTGYDFMNHLNGLYCDGANAGKMSKFYVRFSGLKHAYAEEEYQARQLIVRKNMAGEVDNLARQLKMIATRDVYGSDITMEGLKSALIEIMAFLSVYRTYITREGGSDTDRRYLQTAIAKALEKMPDLLYEIRFIERCLLTPEQFDASMQEEIVRFVCRLQQFTGPVTAKGVEDTLFYRYNRLVSLNEVGGFPARFGIKPQEFHAYVLSRLERFPHGMNATSTHDTKRGEDLRARLNVLSELSYEWEQLVKSLHRRNFRHKRSSGREQVPDKNDEYFLYQTLAATLPKRWRAMEEGAWEAYVGRLSEYLLKSIREAKRHTAWIKPDEAYESGALAFMQMLLCRDYPGRFLEAADAFTEKIRYFGFLNSLSQTILKGAMPGVCDIFQGSEALNLSLVDPDNRRDVDFEGLQRALETMPQTQALLPWLQRAFDRDSWGEIKQYLLRRVLTFRAEHRALFLEGSYRPLLAEGTLEGHVVAFMLEAGDLQLLVAAGRLFTQFTAQGTFPPAFETDETVLKVPGSGGRHYVDILTGARLRSDAEALKLSALFGTFPGVIAVSLPAGTDSSGYEKGRWPS